jgi:KDO2-lipid IV(A) lauroyltransferase
MEDVIRKIYSLGNKTSHSYLFYCRSATLRKSIGYWTIFLNQETPFYLGIEKIARKLIFPVFFMKVDKIKRGYYEAEFILLEENLPEPCL